MIYDSIKHQVVEIIAAALEVDPETIDLDVSFDAMGLDSMAKVSIVPSLEKHFGCHLDSEVLFECNDLNALVAHVALILRVNQ